MKATLFFRQSLIEKALSIVWQPLPIILSATQRKMLLISVLLTNVLISSFAQKTTVLLSTYDSCHVRPPQQTAFATKAVGMAPMVRVAYVIPSNREPQPNGVANLQNAIKLGRQFFKEQMEQNGFGPKTYVFETEADGVTPLVHVVHVAETDEYLREDIWGRTIQAATNAGISLWAEGEVWVVIPEAYLMRSDGTGVGGVALGAGNGSGTSPGVSMIGSNALPLFNPAMITDDTPYDGKVLPELGPYPMKQDMTFAWFEGTTFSSVASSWLGALWHETGHAFGLSHDFRNDNNFHGNLMGNGLRGTRGFLFPGKYPQDYTRLEYASSLLLNVSHYFNRDIKIADYGPNLSHAYPASVIPEQGLVHIPFQSWDADSLSFACLRHRGDMVAEIVLKNIEAADTVFAVPYYDQGSINQYTIVVYDKQGNITYSDLQFNVPAGYNQAPRPFIQLDPAVPGLNQSITLNATQSYDVDHDQSSLLASWDVDNDGQFDIEPSTNKSVQYHYTYGGNYLIRLKLTDAAGAQTISTAVSIKIPGEEQIICKGDVTLSSQAQVDAFNCVEVDGNLTISGADITNLNALSSLRKVSGSLGIHNNDELKTLDGLSGLDYVGDDLWIVEDSLLLNIDGLTSLRIVGGDVNVSHNSNLTNLDGFSSLTEIRNNFIISNNSNLVAISGLSSLQLIVVGLSIDQNNNLISINGFDNLTSVGGISFQSNPNLVDIKGFNSLVTMDKNIFGLPAILSIASNEALTNLEAFSALKSVGEIIINGNKQLANFDGLSSLRSISASIELVDNPELLNINSLAYIESVSDHLFITNNDKLTNLNAFSSLKSVGRILTIEGNNSLSDVDGLSNLNSTNSVERFNLIVSQNPSLTRCCGLRPLLAHLAITGPDDFIQISENGGGCTLQDILACSSQSISGYDIVDTSGKFVRHLSEGDVLYLDDLKCKGQTIVANTTGQIGSVKFDLNNAFFMMQNASPYTLTGDNYGTYFKPWIPQAGAYTLTATPYSQSDAGGVAGKPLTIHLTVKPETVVVSYDIVNTSGTFLRHLNEGDILFLDDLKANGQTIVANTTGEIGSVKFDLNNKFFMMQNVFPYTLTGDNYGTYLQPWVPHPGAYTLTATPYSKPDAVGCAGQPLTIHFMVKPKSSTAVVSYEIVTTSGRFVHRLNEGDVLYLDDLKSKGQTIVANTTGEIGSVKFDVNDAFFMMQNAFPYTLTGDNYGTYFKPWIPQAGAYAITATPYSKSDAGGLAGRSLTIHLTVVDKNKGTVFGRIAGGGEDDSFQSDGVSSVTIYPVPVDNELSVRIDDLAGADALVTICNIHGLAVYQGSYSKSQEINTSQLAAGVYFLQIRGNGGFQEVVKFIKN